MDRDFNASSFKSDAPSVHSDFTADASAQPLLTWDDLMQDRRMMYVSTTSAAEASHPTRSSPRDLIAQLNDDSKSKREQAEAALSALGLEALRPIADMMLHPQWRAAIPAARMPEQRKRLERVTKHILNHLNAYDNAELLEWASQPRNKNVALLLLQFAPPEFLHPNRTLNELTDLCRMPQPMPQLHTEVLAQRAERVMQARRFGHWLEKCRRNQGAPHEIVDALQTRAIDARTYNDSKVDPMCRAAIIASSLYRMVSDREVTDPGTLTTDALRHSGQKARELFLTAAALSTGRLSEHDPIFFRTLREYLQDPSATERDVIQLLSRLQSRVASGSTDDDFFSAQSVLNAITSAVERDNIPFKGILVRSASSLLQDCALMADRSPLAKSGGMSALQRQLFIIRTAERINQQELQRYRARYAQAATTLDESRKQRTPGGQADTGT